MYLALSEDDDFILEQMRFFLHRRGYRLNTYNNGEEVLQAPDLYKFDLFLLDIDTPAVDGFEVLQYLRQNDIKTPVIFVTAKTHIQDMKKGYGLGCDDYVKKPFELEELDLRIGRLAPRKNIIRLDTNLLYDHDTYRLYKNGQTIPLTHIEVGIIDFFVKNGTGLITYSQLQNAVWKDKDISQGTIRSFIRNIRKKTGCDFIQNHRGLGYKLKHETACAL